ncbi:MAG: translocation/assembly module TamB domain-containing protein, partial [bacterium]
SEVMDADVYGKFNYSEIPASLVNLTSYYLPALTRKDSLKKITGPTDKSDLTYSLRLKKVANLARFFTREYFISDSSYISGKYNPSDHDVSLTAVIPALGYKNKTWKDLYFIAEADSNLIEYTGVSSYIAFNNDLGIDNLRFSGLLSNDTITTAIHWHSPDKPDYSGNLNLRAGLSTNPETDNQMLAVEMMPSFFVFNDSLWNIKQSNIYIDSSTIFIDSFHISNQNQALVLSGNVSQQKDSRLAVYFSELDLAMLNPFTRQRKLELQGTISGQASLLNAYQNPVFLSDLIMNNFHFNGQDFGEGNIRALWNNETKSIHTLATAVKGETRILRIEGDYFPTERQVDFDVDFEKIRLAIISPFAEKLVSDVKGLASGKVKMEGTIGNPVMNGELSFFKSSALVDYLQTRYYFNDDLSILDNNLVIDKFELSDESGHKAIANGIIENNYFKDFYLDLNITTPNFTFLNTSYADNELFYGRVLASGITEITGPPDNLNIDINARTEKNSVFNIPLYGAEEVNENEFIRFVNPEGEEIKEIKEKFSYEVNLKGLTMDFNLEITPDAEVQIIFDPSIGDILRGRGSGNLNMAINTLGKFEMYGDMIIENGDYLFTLQNLINKKLEVEPGGTITWNGDPADANIDLKAVYKLRTSVSSLSPGYEDSRLKRRIPVECQIIMTGKLLEPNINTDIVLPTTDQQTRNIVYNSINTEEEKLKQFISLLVMNNFMSLDPGEAFLSSGSGNTANVAGVATSELLSNQLSHLLSQISQDFDIGLNYRPGDQITNDELEVALSTQILEDRITISGNLDVGGNEITQTSATTNTNNIVGDFDIDFKLTENGKLHLKAFNRANDNLIWQARSPYTQGVGVFYREDFNTFGELMRRYRDAILNIFTREEKKAEQEREKTSVVKK